MKHLFKMIVSVLRVFESIVFQRVLTCLLLAAFLFSLKVSSCKKKTRMIWKVSCYCPPFLCSPLLVSAICTYIDRRQIWPLEGSFKKKSNWSHDCRDVVWQKKAMTVPSSRIEALWSYRRWQRRKIISLQQDFSSSKYAGLPCQISPWNTLILFLIRTLLPFADICDPSIYNAFQLSCWSNTFNYTHKNPVCLLTYLYQAHNDIRISIYSV